MCDVEKNKHEKNNEKAFFIILIEIGDKHYVDPVIYGTYLECVEFLTGKGYEYESEDDIYVLYRNIGRNIIAQIKTVYHVRLNEEKPIYKHAHFLIALEAIQQGEKVKVELKGDVFCFDGENPGESLPIRVAMELVDKGKWYVRKEWYENQYEQDNDEK